MGNIRKEKDPQTDKATLRIFWQAIIRHKRLALLSLCFPLGGIAITVVIPLIIGRIIASLSQDDGDPHRYLPALVIAAIAGTLLNRYGARFLFVLQAKAMGELQESAFQGLLKRSMSFHNNNIGGKLVSDAVDYPNAFLRLTDALFMQLLPFCLILICGSTLVFIESWQLGILISIMSAYTIIGTYISSTKRTWVRRRRQALHKEVTSHVADAIVNVATVKTFGHEDRELQSHRGLNHQLTQTRIDDWSIGSGLANTRSAVLLVMQIVFILLLIRAVQNDPAVLDVGIFAFSFITTLSIRLIQLHPLIRQLEDGLLDAAPMTRMLSVQPEIRDAKDAKTLKITKGSIALRDVTFRYDDAEQNDHIFSRLTLTIQPGEKVGLVGPSGGGKSTLTRLLLRFSDVTSGDILIDNQDISQVSQESLRKSIAYVPQEPLLFHRTITENIAYGRPGATQQEIETAAKLAYADDFIRELKGGYDTVVGERGVKLSGGQRQRIAIARAILKDAPILLLDEATSALDSESETYIQKALAKLMQKRTTLVIAHRLSTVQSMDRIVVLEEGRITEQGSHKELLKQKGTYAKLWNHQSGGFIED